MAGHPGSSRPSSGNPNPSLYPLPRKATCPVFTLLCHPQKPGLCNNARLLIWLWLCLFVLAASGPATTTIWLSDVPVSVELCTPDQPEEHIATSPVPVEAENLFCKSVAIVPPATARLLRLAISACFFPDNSHHLRVPHRHGLLPLSPRPPPQSSNISS